MYFWRWKPMFWRGTLCFEEGPSLFKGGPTFGKETLFKKKRQLLLKKKIFSNTVNDLFGISRKFKIKLNKHWCMVSLKEHGKSCIWIFYEKYCVSHIPWHSLEHIRCKMSLTINSNCLIFYGYYLCCQGKVAARQRHLKVHTHTNT